MGEGWKKLKILIAGVGWGVGFKITFFFSFLAIKITVLRTLVHAVKVK